MKKSTRPFSLKVFSLAMLLLSVVATAGCHQLLVPATRTDKIALKSYHGRYVTALDEGGDWLLRQEPGLSDCAWFTRHNLGSDGEGHAVVALETCHGRFVTAPIRGSTRLDRQVWQESAPGDCGQFTLEPQGDGRFAIRTCAGKYLTAGDAGAGWESPLQWAVIVENPRVEDWEKFTIVLHP